MTDLRETERLVSEPRHTGNIAIVGRMYAGKTTLAQELARAHGYTRVAMAGPLKALARMAYGEVVEKDREYPTVTLSDGSIILKSGRRIYQEIGQSMKSVDRNIWLRIFTKDTNDMGRQPYVVDDVRFIFEADYLMTNDWFIIKVETPKSVRLQRASQLNGRSLTPEEYDHESERETDNITADYVFKGTVPIEQIPKHVEKILKKANS